MTLNEKVDGLAKNVSAYDPLIDWISPEDLIRAFTQEIQQQFERSYQSCKYYISHGDIPSTKQIHHWALNRRDDVHISCLLCRMLITSEILTCFKLIADS